MIETEHPDNMLSLIASIQNFPISSHAVSSSQDSLSPIRQLNHDDAKTDEGFPTTMSIDYVRVWQRPEDVAAQSSGNKAGSDWSKDEYMVNEKANWTKNGWPWNRAKVEFNFRRSTPTATTSHQAKSEKSGLRSELRCKRSNVASGVEVEAPGACGSQK